MYRAYGKNFGPDSECISNMTFYLGTSRVVNSDPFTYIKECTLALAAAQIAPVLITVWLLRRWYVFQ